MKDDFRPLDHTGLNLKNLSKKYEVVIHYSNIKKYGVFARNDKFILDEIS